jgi:hypothetical protein
VRDICGLQAQIPTVPALSLWARVAGLERDQVDRMLYRDKSLIKVWCMRGTLHLLPTEDLPIYWRAVMGYQLEEWRRWLRRTGRLRPREERERLHLLLLKALAERPLTRNELSARFPEFVPESGTSWGVDLKELCYLGRVCHANSSGPEARFARLDRWLPEANLETIDLATAQRRLLLNYLHGFGPATAQDFAHWAGFRVGDARPIFAATAEKLAELKIEGLKGQYWVCKEDLPELLDEHEARLPLRLLPQFDVLLLGHKEKGRFLDEVHYKRIFRKAGWISATIWAAGRVIGTWSHKQAGKRLQVAVEPFIPLEREELAALEEEAESLAAFLGARDLELQLTAR